MSMKIIESTSKFHIYSSFTLSPDDVHSLSLLYAPLIGNDAFTLYMAFTSMLERNNLKSEEIIHQDLFDIYSMKPSVFQKVRTMLEGIGLLLTYEKNGDYIYVLLPPLSPKNFIKDATYGLYLYSKMREDTFKFLKRHFEIEKEAIDGFENITKSFDEVFQPRLEKNQTMEKFGYILGKNASSGLHIKDYHFDFAEFQKKINLDFLETGITTQFKNQIMNLAYAYGFNESQMANLYQDSINRRQLFDYKLLKEKANILFNYQRNMNAPSLEAKPEKTLTKDTLMEYLDSATGDMLLSDVLGNYPSEYLMTINDIYSSIELPRGVENCMILKTIRDKNGDLPSIAYFKKMSESWIKDNVFDTASAVQYITTAKLEGKATAKPFASKSKMDINKGWEEL